MVRRSKKEKAEGREKHRQLKRAKKMKRKQKKNVELPKKKRKNKRKPFHARTQEIMFNSNEIQRAIQVLNSANCLYFRAGRIALLCLTVQQIRITLVQRIF